MDQINKDHFLLPNTTLVTDIQYVSASDSFHASKKGELRPIPFSFLPFQQQIQYLRSYCGNPLDYMLLSSKISLIPTVPVSVFLELLLELLVATLFACSTRRVLKASHSYSHYPSSQHPSNEKEDETEYRIRCERDQERERERMKKGKKAEPGRAKILTRLLFILLRLYTLRHFGRVLRKKVECD